MDEWDRDAVHAEIMRLGRAMDQLHRMPSYFDPLAQPTPGAERLITHGDAELSVSDDDIRGAKVELAERHHAGFGQVENMVQSAHQKSGLGYSVPEQVQVVQQVALSLERGRSEVSESQILELSGRPVAGTFGYAAGDGDDEIALSAGTIQETRAMQLSAAGADSPEAVIGRHPELAHLFRAGRTSSGGKHPTGGKKVTSATRAHKPDEEDTHDADQPAGKGTHAKVAKYLKMREEMFGGEALHAGSHGSKSYGPGPYKPPGPAGKPQSSR